jgi:signal transduction histidine kinase
MYWSIRNQILVPLFVGQIIAVAAMTITIAAVAAHRREGEIIDRLSGMIETIEHSNFPLTASVLAKMHGLAGAHFIARDEGSGSIETSVAGLDQFPPALATIPASARLDTLARSPTFLLNGKSYFAVRMRAPGRSDGHSLFVLYPETAYRQSQSDAVMPVLSIGGASLVALALISTWVAHRFSTRVRTVERQVARIAEGDFRELDLGFERDEVRDLSCSINSMCAQLREMRRTIEQTERSRLLGQFAAGLAHQLRNSITGARMSVQLYSRRHPRTDSDQSLEIALKQLAITEEQVKGLLSIGRVDLRAREIYELSVLLDEIALLVEQSCRHAKVSLEVRHPQSLEIVADAAAIRAAVLNLVLNAIEAAGPGGAVQIEACALEDQAAIDVVDTGPGPPAAIADSLYEPFVTGKPEGVGLGLALAQQVAAEHGGRLSWSRRDQETRFRLTLPLAPIAPENSP